MRVRGARGTDYSPVFPILGALSCNTQSGPSCDVRWVPGDLASIFNGAILMSTDGGGYGFFSNANVATLRTGVFNTGVRPAGHAYRFKIEVYLAPANTLLATYDVPGVVNL